LKYVFNGDQRKLRQHVQHGGGVAVSVLSASVAQTNIIDHLLTDVPEMTIAGDLVDEELIDRPRRWNIAFIRKFMLTFGLVSSIFDYITFGVLLLFFKPVSRNSEPGGLWSR